MTPVPVRSPEALAALLRGENNEPLAIRSVSLDALRAVRLTGISPAPGHSALDLGDAAANIVQGRKHPKPLLTQGSPCFSDLPDLGHRKERPSKVSSLNG